MVSAEITHIIHQQIPEAIKLLYTYHLFVSSVFTGDINRYLIPCPLKYLTGYDCPGCGFQRSFLALVKGNFAASFALYPATIPIILTIAISLVANKWYPHQSKMIVKTLFMITSAIIMLSYGIKIFTPHLHHGHI
jgi:hypothetical protein